MLCLCAGVSLADNAPPVALDTNESLFSVLTAINICGYNQELGVSNPLRQQIRDEVTKNIQASEEAGEATKAMCGFYDQHQRPDASRTLAQYISLALFTNPPPVFTTKATGADLPPDATAVEGFLPLLEHFYKTAGLHAVWQAHQPAYADLTSHYHEPLAKMLFDTEIYLKLPSAGYLGRQFTVYLDVMGAPGQTNARQYGSDYYVVISADAQQKFKTDQIRHTYLHYLLDPQALKYPDQLKRLQPLLDAVSTAPMDESFKNDVSLLVTECLIRAVEARLMGKASDEQRQKTIDDAVAQGYILTPYFYDALVKFEKDPAGLRNVYGDLLANIDVRKETKEAAQVTFATQADPELLQLSRPMEGKLLKTAEQRLAVGDIDTAQKLAQQALDENSEDSGHAMFILARVATRNGDMQDARSDFQKAADTAKDPKVVAWSHIYLGRIFDMQENRDAALDHYRAALNAGASLPDIKAAAERGIQQPYEPPAHDQQQQQ